MLKKILLSLSLFALIAHSAVNYPYPMRKNYPGRTINTTNQMASTNLKANFESFVRDFYVEGSCNGGSNNCARIKFDELDWTVSEGIGYGMLMMVYFSDNDKNYQTEFDKLFAYYNANLNSNGVMNWKIQGFTNTCSDNNCNGATDAEFDVALALVMAHYQFGTADGKNYLNKAKDLIGKIKVSEMNADGTHKLGDAWDPFKNPSYVSPAAFEIFKEVDTDNATFWGTAVTANYNLLTSNQNTNTGLPSGWCSVNNNICEPVNGNNSFTAYDMDATRAPWRWAWSKAWYSHSQANTLLTKLASWVNEKSASDVKGPIGLTGTWGTDANSSYIGSLMNALMVNSTYQDKLNSYWNAMMYIPEDAYFNFAMQILTGLLASGNMPNLKACAAGNCGTDMAGGGTFNGEYTSIDKFTWFDWSNDGTEEDNMSFAATLEPWFAYTDEGSEGTSTITNTKFTTKDESKDCEEIESYRVVRKNGNDWVAEIPSYTFSQGMNQYQPYVAIGLKAEGNVNGLYDLSKCTGGVSYQYKGQGHNFKVRTTPIDETSGADYVLKVSTVTTEWTTREVDFGSLIQPDWVAANNPNKVPFNAEEIYGFLWELQGPQATCPAGSGSVGNCTNPQMGATGGVSVSTGGSLAIKDFRCLGEMPLPKSRTNPCSDDAIIEGPGMISGGDTPIRAPKIAAGNKNAFAINNGVSLQVANKAALEVFSIKGNSVRKINLQSGNHTVLFNDLPKGVYIVKISFGNEKSVLRIPVR